MKGKFMSHTWHDPTFLPNFSVFISVRKSKEKIGFTVWVTYRFLSHFKIHLKIFSFTLNN